MIESIVSGLLILVVSGLTFLAYNHHDGYEIISRPLKLLVYGVFLAGSGFYFGFTQGKYHGDKDLYFSHGWFTVTLGCVWLFIGLLDIIPLLTQQKRKDG